MTTARDFAELLGHDVTFAVLRGSIRGKGNPQPSFLRRLPDSFRRDVLGVEGATEADLAAGLARLKTYIDELPEDVRERLMMAFNFDDVAGTDVWVTRVATFADLVGKGESIVRKAVDDDILMLILYAQRSAQRSMPTTVGQQSVQVSSVPTVVAACDLLGVVNAYVPTGHEIPSADGSANDRRTQRKIEVLEAAVERRATVRLIAETGSSYLQVRGPFRKCMTSLLQNAGRLEILLMAPEIHALGNDEMQRMKFKQSLAGYKQLVERFSGRIDLRISTQRLAATMLLTDKESFFEPYVHTAARERELLLLDTFELECSGDSRFHQTLHGNFELHFENGESPRKWLNAY